MGFNRHADHHCINGVNLFRRLDFRAAIASLEFEVKAVGDPFMDLKILAYQVKYNNVHKGSLEPSEQTTTCIDRHADHQAQQWFHPHRSFCLCADIASPKVDVKAVKDPSTHLKFVFYQVTHDSVHESHHRHADQRLRSSCRLPWASMVWPQRSRGFLHVHRQPEGCGQGGSDLLMGL